MADDKKLPHGPMAGFGILVWSNVSSKAKNTDARQPGTGSPIQMTLADGYGGRDSEDPDLRNDARVHRIMRFDGFGLERVVADQELTFVTHHHWEDKYEGFLAREMKTMEGVIRVAKLLEKMNISVHAGLTAAQLQMTQHSLHMQSWTSAGEKCQMWEEYSPKDRTSVLITTSLGKLRRMEYMLAHKVLYRDNLTLEEEVAEVFPSPEALLMMDYSQLFRRKKKKEYAHEEEVRLVISSVGFEKPSETPTLRKVSFAEIEDFIESVTVDPLATDNHVDKVRLFCEANKIPFAGRSKLEGCKRRAE